MLLFTKIESYHQILRAKDSGSKRERSDPGRRYGKCLFAPRVNRSGYLIKNSDNQRLVKLVRARIEGSRHRMRGSNRNRNNQNNLQ
jgi:hypothetical protein